MEQNFQTSFIPKKPIVENTVIDSRPVSFFLVVAIFIFISSALAFGGLYFYKGILETSAKQKKVTLEKAEGRFEVDKIKLLKNLDRKLIAAKEVLNNHIAVSPIFRELQGITIKTVQFTRFDYTIGEDKKITIKLNGTAVGYRSVALQSDLVSQNKNFIDPVFSNLNLDDKGNVLFELTFEVDPLFVDFDTVVQSGFIPNNNSSDNINNITNTTETIEQPNDGVIEETKDIPIDNKVEEKVINKTKTKSN